MNFKQFLFFCATGFLLFACNTEKENMLPSQFTLLDFENKVIDTEDLNILTYLYFYNGAGVAVADIVGDDLPDIYMVSNLGENKLLENMGNMSFRDVTATAGVAGKADWQTGTAIVDINSDGLQDIFVCSVNNIHGFTGHNELYINEGNGRFSEQAAAYGVDQQDFSTAATFFDYDRDGDLDLYLLNHAVHTEDGYRKPAEQVRGEVSESAGDRLLRNDGGSFTDVSIEAGIIRSKVSYGLAVKAADLNLDGWPDLYVSNDFHENDYIYLNQGDGSFTLSTNEMLRYSTKYSMGNDVADVNNDGWPDVFVADMEPWDEQIKQTTQGEDLPEIFAFKLGYGYARQYARNTLQLSDRGQRFYDVAQQYGIGATDWSWSPIFDDFNQDGKLDLFVSNGIWRRPNNLDFLNYISGITIKQQLQTGNKHDLEIVERMPTGLVENQFFLQEEQGFSLAEHAGFDFADSSTGTASADFDGDGDLDLVINRLNEPALIWENRLSTGHSLVLQFSNPSTAYGTKAVAHVGDQRITKELFPQRGFMSQSQPLLHFGLGTADLPDSLVITWFSGEIESYTRENLSNQMMLQVPKGEISQPAILQAPTKSLQAKYNSQPFATTALLPYLGFTETESFSVTKKDIQVDLRPFQSPQIKVNDEAITHNAPKGFWQSAAIFDKDNDGDLDVLLGNLGLNHRLTASAERPLRLYIYDFDDNGQEEYIWAVAKNNAYYPLLHKDEIAKQLVFLNKEFTSYESFANQTVEDIFGAKLQDARLLEIDTFESGWLVQQNDGFTWQPLLFAQQQGPITAIEQTANNQWQISGSFDKFVPYIGYLELPKQVWNEGSWKNM